MTGRNHACPCSIMRAYNLNKWKEVLGMFSDALKIMDQNTVKYMIDEQQKVMDAQQKKINEQQQEMDEQRKKMNEQQQVIDKQAARIRELEALATQK